MTVFNSPVEIDGRCAKEMAGKGARLIWVLGRIDSQRQAMLLEISDKIYSVYFEDIVRSEEPERLVGKAPVFVCEHGITSLFVANRLRGKGIEAYSLGGGIEGLFKW